MQQNYPLMCNDLPISQHCRPKGNHPVSVAVWTPERNGWRGLAAAIENQRVWGGHVFMSETKLGYVVWFDASYTPNEIFAHELTSGHSGVVNPSIEHHQVYELASFMETVAQPVASETMLPQEVYYDQDGMLNHTCFGARYIGRGVVSVLPGKYFLQ